jgi:hypothetical protein
MVGALSISNTVDVTGTLLSGNNGDNAFINTGDAGDRIHFDGVESTAAVGGPASGAGFRIQGAPGQPGQALTEVPLNVTSSEYGFWLDNSDIHGNTGDGVVVSRNATTPNQVTARIGGVNDIHTNGGVGFRLSGTAITGATIVSNHIFDNADSGVVIGDSIIIPLFNPPIDQLGLGFVKNSINSNAIESATCTGPQTAPQILVNGNTQSSAAIATCSANGSDQAACNADRTASNNFHCAFNANTCFAVHDMRGGIGDNCPTGNRNSIFGYNTSDSGQGAELSVGARAVTTGRADMSNNEWQSATQSDNVTDDGSGAFILNDLTCVNTTCSG